jgi:phospholipase D1/2
MIVDDRACIIGSANINDRSLLGNRDSEVALYIEDTQFKNALLNKKTTQVGLFTSSLRHRLFREFLGELNTSNEFIDPCSDEFYKQVLIKHASQNTHIYDLVFKVIPCDYVSNFEQLREYQKLACLNQTDTAKAREELKRVKGYVVLYPNRFLVHQDLTPPLGTKEKLLPTILWT